MTRASSIRDHVRPRNQPNVSNEVVEQRVKDLLTPASMAKVPIIGSWDCGLGF